MYWLVLLDDYSAGFGLMVVVITTCLVVTRIYGEETGIATQPGWRTKREGQQRWGCGSRVQEQGGSGAG